MTRLQADDIQSIASQLKDYNQELQMKTGRSLFGIACHCYGVDESAIMDRGTCFSFHVVPVTAGQGVIRNFSTTVCAILRFLGFTASVAEKSDAAGIALAFENGADSIFLSDDQRFVGINLRTRSVVDNSEATGRVYSAALELVAGGVKDRDILVLGCGPVGAAATRHLHSLGARVALHDISYPLALSLYSKIKNKTDVVIEEDLLQALTKYRYIVDATPASMVIPDDKITDETIVAGPGVPLGVSARGQMLLNNRLIHDKLELGVAAMAVSLLSPT